MVNMIVDHIGSQTRTNMETFAKPYCQCWNKKVAVSRSQLSACVCGEDNHDCEWTWEDHEGEGLNWVVLSEDKKQLTFHPFYSSGTAAAKGDTALIHNYHYYWEIKILTETYGTDIMVGVGTNKVKTTDSNFEFTSLLGQDAESYGFSYKGAVRHDGIVVRDSLGFCRGSIVGVRLDMWQGTLEFFVNRKPQGTPFYNLRRHPALYPMACSTAAQSSMRLIYSASWRASLLVDAAKTLAASLRSDRRKKIPPGLWYTLKSHFWLTLPTDGCVLSDEEEESPPIEMEPVKVSSNVSKASSMKRRHWQMKPIQACVQRICDSTQRN